MLHRWLTTRCWCEDVPGLVHTKAAVIKFLAQQDPKSAGTEKWIQSEKADAFTYHLGDGRGVRWKDTARNVLWLVGFRDGHDEGYKLCADRQAAGTLWPRTDPTSTAETAAHAPWGEFVDEDAYEWARMIYGALETWEINREALRAGETISYPCALHLELSRDDDDIWTLSVRRAFAYLDPAASLRQRRVRNDEIRSLARSITALEDEDFSFDDPPHPQHFNYALAHFLGEPLTPAQWLEHQAQVALQGAPPRTRVRPVATRGPISIAR